RVDRVAVYWLASAEGNDPKFALRNEWLQTPEEQLVSTFSREAYSIRAVFPETYSALRRGKPVAKNRADFSPIERNTIDTTDIESVLILPIQQNGELLG